MDIKNHIYDFKIHIQENMALKYSQSMVIFTSIHNLKGIIFQT